tara:strand:+ start:8380 stop:8961 length:582 start_codon:yes stop_codon:yes gene_type:complete
MIQNGKGGEKTNKWGKVFENETSDFEDGEIISINGFDYVYIDQNNSIVYLEQFKGEKEYVKKLKPDGMFRRLCDNYIHIIEKKHQLGSGTTDEKIGLGSHKLKQYSKRYPNADFRFSYMLNECFWNSLRYEDTYEIMSEEGIGFFFVGGENAAMRKTTLTNNTKKKIVYFPARYEADWKPIFEHIHVRAPPLF